MSTYHYDGSPCPESCTCAVREVDRLRAQLEAVTRERDEARATVVTTGRTLADLKLNLDEVHAEMERQTQLKREERQAKLDAQRERDEARADAARLRDVLERLGRGPCYDHCETRGDRAHMREMWIVAALRVARAALASTPSAEPTRTDAERWLGDGPKEPGGTLAFHVEPTPRDMRVAEAVREACVETADASDEASRRVAGDLRDLDLAAVVTKAVKP